MSYNQWLLSVYLVGHIASEEKSYHRLAPKSALGLQINPQCEVEYVGQAESLTTRHTKGIPSLDTT